MRLSLAASLLACTAVQAFQDSTPFVLFSTASFADRPNDEQLQTNTQVLATAEKLLAACPTERYLLVSQPNLHASDISKGGSTHTANLRRAYSDARVKGRYSVSEVIGSITPHELSKYVRAACVAKGTQITIAEQELKALPTQSREAVLEENDRKFGVALEGEAAGSDYTVIYFASSTDFKPYESEFIQPVHMELKRQSQPIIVGRAPNGTSPGLFEKYQFFTPGIFMGFIALFLMGSILTVGLKAVSSLEISTGAFDKENGPAAQKKQM